MIFMELRRGLSFTPFLSIVLSCLAIVLYLISCNYLDGLPLEREKEREREEYIGQFYNSTAIYQIVIVNCGLIFLFLLHFINFQQ